MLWKKASVAIATSLITVASGKWVEAAQLYSVTPLPSYLPNMQWFAFFGGTYAQNGFDINNSGQVSYQILTQYGLKRNDAMDPVWRSMWNNNLGTSLITEGKRSTITPEMWSSFWTAEVSLPLFQGQHEQIENLTEEQRITAYNYMIGAVGKPGALDLLYAYAIKQSYVWDPLEGSYYLGQGKVTGISESGWATFNNELGGSFAYNINTGENFGIPVSERPDQPTWSFTSINDQDQVAVQLGSFQGVLDLSSASEVTVSYGSNWQDSDQSLKSWNNSYGSNDNYFDSSFCGIFNQPDKICGYDMNQVGQVVGTKNNGAFLWEEGEFYNLNDLVFNGGGSLVAATAINDLGQIVAISSYSNLIYSNPGFGTGQPGSLVLLTPIPEKKPEEKPTSVPEPSSLLGLLSLGFLTLIKKFR